MKDRTKGILMAIGAAFFYALIAASVKWIDGIPPFEKFFFRSTFGFVFICIIMAKRKVSFRPVDPVRLSMRGVTGVIAGIAYYLAVSEAPLAEISTLGNLFPFLVVILSAIFLKEKIRNYHLAALALSFTGTLLVIQPAFSAVNLYYIIAFTSSIFLAISYTLLKQVRRTDTAEMVVFIFCLIGMIGGIPFMLAGRFVMPSAFQFFQFIVLGLNATVYQILVSSAYKYAPAGELSIYSYTAIIFSPLIGVALWREYPAATTIAGIASILLGGYVMFRRERNGVGLPE